MKLPSFLYPLVFLFTAVAALAQPINDNRANAVALPNANQVSLFGSSFRATTEAFERDPAYPVPIGPFFSVWYKWTAPTATSTQIDVTANFDCTLALFVREEDESFTFLGFDDDAGDGLNSRLIFTPQGGRTYFIAVDSFRNTVGIFNLIISQTGQPSDSFANRTQYFGNNFIAIGNNSTFTAETGEPSHGEGNFLSRKTAWITWTSTSRARVSLNTANSLFNTVVSVYTGTELTDLTLVAQNDNNSSRDLTSSLTFTANPGQTYHFAVDGNNNTSGIFYLNLGVTPIPPGLTLNPTTRIVFDRESAVFSVIAAGTGEITYQWQRRAAGTKTWVNLAEDPSSYTGVTTDTMTVVSAPLEMTRDSFRVLATDTIGTSTSGTATLVVTEFRDTFTEVRGTVSIDLTASTLPRPIFDKDGNEDVPENPTRYFATGLPKGLTIDPDTGLISGVVTGKPGTYRVTYGTFLDGTNKRNPDQLVLYIYVTAFAPAMVGQHEGMVANIDGDALPAGKLSIRVATNGTFTGTYYPVELSRNISFKGTLDLFENSRTATNTTGTRVLIKRGGALSPLYLEFTLSEGDTTVESSFTTFTATLYDAPTEGAVVGQCLFGRAVGRFNTAKPAPWASNYTVRLTDLSLVNPNPDISLPLGDGHATGKVALPGGALSLRGRLPDNTLFTANVASSPDAEYVLAVRAHSRAGGYLAGYISLDPQITNDFQTLSYHSEPASNSTLFWVKPAIARSTLYPAGFGPASMTFLMEPWKNPTGAYRATFGLSSTGEIKLNILGEDVANNALTTEVNDYDLPINLVLNDNGTLTLTGTNTTKFSLKITPTSGAFTGSFTLTEAEAVPPATRPLVRKVSFSGVLFQPVDTFQGDVIGGGLFVLPPETRGEPTTTGLIEFRAGPPDSPFIVK